MGTLALKVEKLRVFPFLCALLGGLSLAACPGTLSEPERFVEGGASVTCPPGTDVEKDIFAPVLASGKTGGCASSLCHDADEPAAGLDLETAGIASRVVGVASTGSSNEGVCDGEVLVDPASPLTSLFLEKVEVKTPRCGDRMPLGTPLPAAQIDCVRKWVEEIAGAGNDGGSTGGAGGTSGSAGSSGSAGAGG